MGMNAHATGAIRDTSTGVKGAGLLVSRAALFPEAPYGCDQKGRQPLTGCGPEDQNVDLSSLVCDDARSFVTSSTPGCIMADTVIENPILNSPFREPKRHFRFDDDGITNDDRRGASGQLLLRPDPAAEEEGQATRLRHGMDEGPHRGERVDQPDPPARRALAEGGYAGVTSTTRQLLDYWTHPDRERKLFFCQIEALETAIYLTEAAASYGDAWIENQLREANDAVKPWL